MGGARLAFFTFRISRGLRHLPPRRTWPVLSSLPEGDVIRPLFRQVAWLTAARPPGWEAVAEGAVRQMLVTLVLGYHREGPTSQLGLPPALARAMDFIYGETLSGGMRRIGVDELARAGHVSRTHLAKLARESLGFSPGRLLQLLRLHRAAELLAGGELAVKEVASSTGFANQFNLSRAFKSVYGVPPATFRARTRQGLDVAQNPLAVFGDLSWRARAQSIDLTTNES